MRVDLICTDPPFNTGKDWGAFNDKWDRRTQGVSQVYGGAVCRDAACAQGPVSALRSNGKPLFESDVGNCVWYKTSSFE